MYFVEVRQRCLEQLDVVEADVVTAKVELAKEDPVRVPRGGRGRAELVVTGRVPVKDLRFELKENITREEWAVIYPSSVEGSVK